MSRIPGALSATDVSRFSVVSVFCGCGGSSLGYKQAGGKILLAVDNDADALDVYRTNLPGTRIHQGDVRDLSARKCCRLAGIRPGELHVLDGSPPCQGFSAVGKRRLGDMRNELVFEFVRLLDGLQPKVFVMENVGGMVRGVMRLAFADCLESMKASGYRVKAFLLDTQYYNVPQTRERIVFLGVRADLGIEPSFPKGRSEPQSVRQALKLHGTGGVRNTHFKSEWRSLDMPCVTIVARHPPVLRLDGSERPLTFAECSLLQGFPSDWIWPKKIHRYVGNSVPPPFMRAIAEHVRDEILGVVNKQPPDQTRHEEEQFPPCRENDAVLPLVTIEWDSDVGTNDGGCKCGNE
jgi:DNA (cytosine-5)-methyltransferase 1